MQTSGILHTMPQFIPYASYLVPAKVVPNLEEIWFDMPLMWNTILHVKRIKMVGNKIYTIQCASNFFLHRSSKIKMKLLTYSFFGLKFLCPAINCIRIIDSYTYHRINSFCSEFINDVLVARDMLRGAHSSVCSVWNVKRTSYTT